MKKVGINLASLLVVAVIGMAIIFLVNPFLVPTVEGAHTAGNYKNCPAGSGFGGVDGFCDENSPPDYFSNIAQNVPWCQNDSAHTWSCVQACQDAGYGSTSVCPTYAYEWFYHPTQDFGYLYQGTCSISGVPCQGPDQTKGWVGARACSEPTVNSTWCGPVVGSGPTATCSPASQSASVSQNVNFTGSASDGEAPYTYSWSAPGGTTPAGSGSSFQTSYASASPATKTVTLTVTDNDGNTDTDQCSVSIGGGGGGSGSVTLGSLTTRVRPFLTGSYADSYSGNTPGVNLDVQESFQIINGCTAGSPCDFRYMVDCTNNGTGSSGMENTSNQFNRLNGNYTQTFTPWCNNMPAGNYSLRGRVEVWPVSNPSDITWAEDLVPISITTPPPAVPTVTLNANPTSVAAGGTSTLTWSTTDATSCVASNGWSGVKATSGSEPTAPITTNTTYRLDCGGSSGVNAFDTATVTVSGPSPDVSVAITAVNGNSPDLRDIKNGDVLTFEIVYRNAGTGNATSIQNVQINLSSNHQITGSVTCPVSGPNCNNTNTTPQQFTFNRNAALGPGNSFTVRFNSTVNTGTNQPLEILTINTNGIFNPGAIPFDETFALIAGANREPSPGFREVAP